MEHDTVGENSAFGVVQSGYEDSDGDEIDEELEALLYSQVHYKCDDTMDKKTDETQHIMTTSSGAEFVCSLSLTELSPSPKETYPSELPSIGQRSQLIENIPFDSKNLTDKYQMTEKNSFVSRNSSVTRDTVNEYQTPEIKLAGKTSVDSSNNRRRKLNFDIEAELGIDASPIRRKSKTISAKDQVSTNLKFSSPKLSEAGSKQLTSDFIRIDGQTLPHEQDYRKKAKDVSALKSDSESSSSVNDDSDSESSSDSILDQRNESSMDSSCSDSDIEFLDNITHNHSADKATEKPPLDLNWNVTPFDRQTIEKVEESKWKVVDADMNSNLKRSQTSRYFNNIKKMICCHNCKKQGHLSKVCPEPKKKTCGFCGEEGHTMQRCKKQLCFNCHQAGHKGSQCQMPKRDRFVKCQRCWTKGHTADQCPDRWRQYHMTTTTSEDLVPRKTEVNPLVYCCNCGKQGHFAFECRRDRMDNYIFPSYPFIVRYDVDDSRRTEGEPSYSSGHHKRPADRDGGPDKKRLKSNHHHSNVKHQSLYPRGPHNSFQGNLSRSQVGRRRRKFLRQLGHKQPDDNRTLHASFLHEDGQDDTAPTLSPASKKMAEQVLTSRPTQKTRKQKKRRPQRNWHFDGQRQDDFHHPSKKSHKRQDGPADFKDFSTETNPSNYKKKRKRKRKKKNGETGGGSSANNMPATSTAVMGRQQQEKKRPKTSHKPENSSRQGIESLVVTCSAGFRTTKRTVNFHHNSHNKL